MARFPLFLGMALATYFTRYSMIAVLGRELPSQVRRWLRYVPPAVLAALVAPAALTSQGDLEIGLPAWATLVGIVFAWRTRSILWTISGGMMAFWFMRLFGLE